MLYELLLHLIYHDPIRLRSGRIWEVIMERNEKESLMTMVSYKVTKTLSVAH